MLTVHGGECTANLRRRKRKTELEKNGGGEEEGRGRREKSGMRRAEGGKRARRSG